MTKQRIRSALLLAGLPILSAALMWAAMSYINRPDSAGAAALVPSVISEEVQEQELESVVTSRGDVVEADAVDIRPSGEVGYLEGEAVYTGSVAKVGSRVTNGTVLVEISGRPVFAIEGSTPMYRSLTLGAVGDDVKQLERALSKMGHFRGSPDRAFDKATARAVVALYSSAGHEAVKADAISDSGEMSENTSGASSKVMRSRASNAPVMVPRGEVVFIPRLPRRVSTVAARVGKVPGDSIYTLTGDKTVVVANIPPDQAKLIRKGSEVSVSDAISGVEARGTVSKVANRVDSRGTIPIKITSSDDIRDLVGANVRVRIPVSATKGKVLAVTPAAVYTADDGSTYVDLITDDTPGAEVSKRVKVRLGLAANSLIEIRPVGSQLKPGDRIVIAKK